MIYPPHAASASGRNRVIQAEAIPPDREITKMGGKKLLATCALVVAGMCVLPLGLGIYPQHVLIVSLFYVMMASSWNLLAGYTGQVSFGHAAMAGIGVSRLWDAEAVVEVQGFAVLP